MRTTPALLPANWRTVIPSCLEKAPASEIREAFEVAEEILKSRGDTEIKAAAAELLQSIATPQGPGGVAVPDPRAIFCAFSHSQPTPPAELSLLEKLAVGSIIAVGRACEVLKASPSLPLRGDGAKVVFTARAFAEWMYMASMQDSGFFPSKRTIRKAVATKIKEKKSAAAKIGAETAHGVDKAILFDWYDKHQAEFKSLAKAADAAMAAKPQLFLGMVHSTIYTWLRAYVKSKKSP